MKLKYIIIISIITAVFTSCTKEPKGYTINGTFTHKNDIDSVYIYEYGEALVGKILSKAPVVNNKFVLTGKTDVITKVIFGNMDKDFGGDIIIENTNFTIEGNSKNIIVKGGKVHEKVLGFVNDPEYIKVLNTYNTEMEVIFNGVDMQDEKGLAVARAKADALGEKVMDYEDKVFEAIINDKEESTITKLMALITSQDSRTFTKELRLKLLDEYEKELGSHPDIELHRKFLNAENEISVMRESVKNGNPYKEVIAKDINGNSIVLSELIKKNKYTLLEFWASWCGPCRAEIPNLKKAYKKYNKLGLEIYSVSIDAERGDWEEALKEEKTNWPNSLIVGDERIQVDAYGVQGIPASFLINQEGTIVASNNELREFDLDRTLNKFLK